MAIAFSVSTARARFFCQLLTMNSHPAILIMKVDSFCSFLNFFFYPLAHTRRFFLSISWGTLTFGNHRDILIIVIQELFFFFFHCFFPLAQRAPFFFVHFPEEHLTFQNHRDILISQSNKWPFSICFFNQFNYSNKLFPSNLDKYFRAWYTKIRKNPNPNLQKRKCVYEPVKFKHH